MHREPLPIVDLDSWACVHDVEMDGVAISHSGAQKGHGILMTKDASEENQVLITVPKNLVLTVETIWDFAESDQQLKSILTAVKEFGTTARGAILIFLLVQITAKSSNTSIRSGNASPWTDYVRFLPFEFSLPTFWTEEESHFLKGTTLEPARRNKLRHIHREFAQLKASTESLDQCRVWWDADCGCLIFQDYLRADAIYRSRAMDLPGTGLALVPCIDMANHGSGDAMNAYYVTDKEGNAALVLADGRRPKADEEVLISYGDDKGASEMLFSYGFIDEKWENARSLFLNLEIPGDDPLKDGKEAVFHEAQGFRLLMVNDYVAWFGPFVWLACINKDDGLALRAVQHNDGTQEVKLSWKGREIADAITVEHILEEDFMWAIFRLRAHVLINQRIREQLSKHESLYDEPKEAIVADNARRPWVRDLALTLLRLEQNLLRQAASQFDDEIIKLAETNDVKRYLDPEADLGLPVNDYSDSDCADLIEQDHQSS